MSTPRLVSPAYMKHRALEVEAQKSPRPPATPRQQSQTIARAHPPPETKHNNNRVLCATQMLRSTNLDGTPRMFSNATKRSFITSSRIGLSTPSSVTCRISGQTSVSSLIAEKRRAAAASPARSVEAPIISPKPHNNLVLSLNEGSVHGLSRASSFTTRSSSPPNEGDIALNDSDEPMITPIEEPKQGESPKGHDGFPLQGIGTNASGNQRTHTQIVLELADVSASNLALRTRIQNLLSSLAASNCKIKELEQGEEVKATLFTKEMERMKSQTKNSPSGQSLENEVQTLKRRMYAMAEKTKNQSTELDAQATVLTSTREVCDRLHQAAKWQQEELTSLTNQNVKMKNKLSEYAKSFVKMREDSNRVKQEIRAYSAQSHRLKKSIRVRTAEYDKLKNSFKALQQEMCTMERAVVLSTTDRLLSRSSAPNRPDTSDTDTIRSDAVVAFMHNTPASSRAESPVSAPLVQMLEKENAWLKKTISYQQSQPSLCRNCSNLNEDVCDAPVPISPSTSGSETGPLASLPAEATTSPQTRMYNEHQALEILRLSSENNLLREQVISQQQQEEQYRVCLRARDHDMESVKRCISAIAFSLEMEKIKTADLWHENEVTRLALSEATSSQEDLEEKTKRLTTDLNDALTTRNGLIEHIGQQQEEINGLENIRRDLSIFEKIGYRQRSLVDVLSHPELSKVMHDTTSVLHTSARTSSESKLVLPSPPKHSAADPSARENALSAREVETKLETAESLQHVSSSASSTVSSEEACDPAR